MKAHAIKTQFCIYNELNDVIYIINRDLEMVYFNRKFETYYGNSKNFTSKYFFTNTILKNTNTKEDIINHFNSSDTEPFIFKMDNSIAESNFTLQLINSEKHLILVLEKPDYSQNLKLNSVNDSYDAVSKLVYKHMVESIALYKVITDNNNEPIDFEYLAVNTAFEDSVGINGKSLRGKLLFEEFPNTEYHWKKVHKDAYKHQKLVNIKAYSLETKKHWNLKVFPVDQDKIAVLASDISENKNFEESIQEKNEQLIKSEEKLRAFNEHLKYTCELIKESELSYKTLFEQNNDAILIFVNEKIKDCNNRALKLMNCQPYDIIGKTLIDLSPINNNNGTENPKLSLHNICKSIKEKEKYSHDWKIKRPDGKLVDTNIQLSCYTLENTKHVYAIVRDLTKEKTYIEEIKENEYLLEEAQRTAKLGHWSFNMNAGGNMAWSAESKKILETDIQSGFFDFYKTMVHPDDLEKIASIFDHFTNIPDKFDIQFNIITPNKKTKFIHTKGKIVTQGGNKICRGIIQDITSKHEQDKRTLFESKINESLAIAGTNLILPSLSIDNIVRTIFKSCIELTQSKTGFVAYDDPLSDKILVHYYDYSYVNGNKVSNNIFFIKRQKYKTEGLYGYPINLSEFEVNNKFNSTTLKEIGKTSPKIINNFLTFPSIINNKFTGQIVLINSPKGFTDIHINAINSLSNIYGLAILRKRMEWDLVSAKERAEESDRLKSAFLANMSHEIRTPMNAIIGFSQLLIHANLSQEKKCEFGNLINNSCEDLLSIVNDIIDISKIESGQLNIETKAINLDKTLNEIHSLAIYKAQLKEKCYPINLINNVNKNLELIVDGIRFKQILLNIIDNAIKFTEQGSVTIGCEISETNWIEFYVKDTGIGIPQKEQDTVFESFRQVEKTIDRTYGGTGLGLAISKSLVLQMGGAISVHSKENVGSKFWFKLPLKLPDDSSIMPN